MLAPTLADRLYDPVTESTTRDDLDDDHDGYGDDGDGRTSSGSKKMSY